MNTMDDDTRRFRSNRALANVVASWGRPSQRKSALTPPQLPGSRATIGSRRS